MSELPELLKKEIKQCPFPVDKSKQTISWRRGYNDGLVRAWELTQERIEALREKLCSNRRLPRSADPEWKCNKCKTCEIIDEVFK